MSETRKPGFFRRLFGIPAEPGPEREVEEVGAETLPPEFLPASEVLDVAPEAANPEEVAAELDSEREAGIEPEPEAVVAAEAIAEAEPLDALIGTPEPVTEPEPEPELASITELEPVAETFEPPPPPGPPEATVEYVEEIEADGVPESLEVEPVPEVPAGRQSWFQRLAGGLKRSSDQISGNIAAVFTKRRLDAAMLDDLEDILIQADLGIDTATAITDALRRDRFDREISANDVRKVLADEVKKVLEPVAEPLVIDGAQKPFVILMVGVNGSGKTTTIGKLAQKLSDEGRSVMLAAGDTFRAAAIEQLQVWGERTHTPVVARPAGADASGLAFDAVTEAKAAGKDVLIIDTAGRLQNRAELMGELEKIIRVIRKVDPSAPHAVLLTLDATTGQNALNQVEIFGQKAGVTGLVMTKLDGTARGGILVAIAKKFSLPVHFIGVGEGVEDLQAFKAADFAAAIAGRES